MLPDAKVYGVPSQNAIVMRGTPDELLLAQKLIDDLDKARPEVVVDIAVLEVSKNWERNLGVSWPSSASVALQTSTSRTSSSSSSSCTTRAVRRDHQHPDPLRPGPPEGERLPSPSARRQPTCC